MGNMTQPPSLICSQSVFDCPSAAGPGEAAACAKAGRGEEKGACERAGEGAKSPLHFR